MSACGAVWWRRCETAALVYFLTLNSPCTCAKRLPMLALSSVQIEVPVIFQATTVPWEFWKEIVFNEFLESKPEGPFGLRSASVGKWHHFVGPEYMIRKCEDTWCILIDILRRIFGPNVGASTVHKNCTASAKLAESIVVSHISFTTSNQWEGKESVRIRRVSVGCFRRLTAFSRLAFRIWEIGDDQHSDKQRGSCFWAFFFQVLNWN